MWLKGVCNGENEMVLLGRHYEGVDYRMVRLNVAT